MTNTVSEPDLVLPALWCLSQDDNKTISTTDLQVCLRKLLRPSGIDLEILTNRNDDRFSQKVRNLRSHKTLERLGFVTYRSIYRNGLWTITEQGTEFLQDNLSLVMYLFSNGFDYVDRKEALRRVEVKLSSKSHEGKDPLFLTKVSSLEKARKRLLNILHILDR